MRVIEKRKVKVIPLIYFQTLMVEQKKKKLINPKETFGWYSIEYKKVLIPKRRQ